MAALGGELLAVLARLVEVAAMEDHLSAERAHGFNLHRVRLLRYADHSVHPEQARGVSDRLAVVPGRRRDDTPAPVVRAELADQVDPAPHLERTDRLVVLVLHPQPRSGQRIEGRIAVQRGRLQVGRDALPCCEHVGQIGDSQFAHDTCLPNASTRTAAPTPVPVIPRCCWAARPAPPGLAGRSRYLPWQ